MKVIFSILVLFLGINMTCNAQLAARSSSNRLSNKGKVINYQGNRIQNRMTNKMNKRRRAKPAPKSKLHTASVKKASTLDAYSHLSPKHSRPRNGTESKMNIKVKKRKSKQDKRIKKYKEPKD